jgi:hypothetical protein
MPERRMIASSIVARMKEAHPAKDPSLMQPPAAKNNPTFPPAPYKSKQANVMTTSSISKGASIF